MFLEPSQMAPSNSATSSCTFLDSTVTSARTTHSQRLLVQIRHKLTMSRQLLLLHFTPTAQCVTQQRSSSHSQTQRITSPNHSTMENKGGVRKRFACCLGSPYTIQLKIYCSTTGSYPKKRLFELMPTLPSTIAIDNDEITSFCTAVCPIAQSTCGIEVEPG